ncbi:hypothetical protein [Thermohalobacter berrensis]|uniref:Glutamine amidotransferase domain-containing protein n=1 Tax=Thermohalobacter berrensis TaxID=99594 RepID=A0A419T4V2_9FIRM|nr:hypothetical protein [Thermohalobacter berrensis]RKD32560.1 hypothetical protein BET03_10820 [Thermohalobacter berrensis]
MQYVFIPEILNLIDIDEILNNCKNGYINITPNIKNILVVNLGMSKKELTHFINNKCNIYVFGKNFSLNQLKNLSFDAIFISDGKLHFEELEVLVEKIKKYIGVKTILGVGLGKDVIEMAICKKQGDNQWDQNNGILKNERYGIYCSDNNSDDSLKKLLKLSKIA